MEFNNGAGVNTLNFRLNGIDVVFTTTAGQTAAQNSLDFYNFVNSSYSSQYSIVRGSFVAGIYRVDVRAYEDSMFYNFAPEVTLDDDSVTMWIDFLNDSEVPAECTLLIGSVTPTDETGEDLNDGSVDSSTSGAFGAPAYSLDGVAFVETSLFTGLAPGDYTYYVRDENDCLVTQSFTIQAFNVPDPEIPGECFDPTLVISELNPYRFVIKHCSEEDNTEKLYSETEMCGVHQPCYFQPVKCTDIFTLQLYYIDEVFSTIPRLRIVDYESQAILYTLDFIDILSGFYKLDQNISDLPDICEKRVYLEVVSYSEFHDLEYYVHAKSEPIKVSNNMNCNLLLEYWNDSDYNEMRYEDTDYINKLRLEAICDEEELPQDSTVYVKSNGERVLISETIHEVWNLEVNYAPFYVHKKIALALSHQHVRINGREYVKEEPYSFERVPKFALRKGLGKLSAKNYQSKNLIY